MTPNPRQPSAVPIRAATAGRPSVITAWTGLAAALLVALGGCAQWQGRTAEVQRRVHEIGCTSECVKVKEQCDDSARYQYRQCEAGYQEAQRAFRWCNSRGDDECGYPWWSCSENLYGYCTNRFNECAQACRRGA